MLLRIEYQQNLGVDEKVLEILKEGDIVKVVSLTGAVASQM